MAQSKGHKSVTTLTAGRKDSSKAIILFHGYTGSPQDFGTLPEELAEKLDAYVIAPLLPGHGTVVSDLLPIDLEDLFQAAKAAVLEIADNGNRQIVVGGHSLGAYLAMLVAADREVGMYVSAVFTSVIPVKLRIPFSFPFAQFLAKRKTLWEKHFSETALRERKKSFYYTQMPGKALSLVIRGRNLLAKQGKHIKCSVLAVHDSHDALAHTESANISCKHIPPGRCSICILNTGRHNLFLSELKDVPLHNTIVDFCGKALRQHTPKKNVAAIVPTYNEGKRIEPVLKALAACPDISKIVVVDDGSAEPPTWIRDAYPDIELIEHSRNRGKGAALQTGVEATDADYLFFCDADLVDLLPEHVSTMIRKVTSGAYRTFLGIRSNPEQRIVPLFALNTGERCLLRSDWLNLPPFYKKGFRVETGLNFYTIKKKGVFGHAVFPYYQTLKEQKYGFWKGFKQRLLLIYEVGTAWLRIVCIDLWRT